MYEKVILLVEQSIDDTLLNDIKEHILQEYRLQIEVITLTAFDRHIDNALYLLYLSDTEIINLFSKDIAREMSFAIIPNETCPYAISSYGMSKDVLESIDDAFDEKEAVAVDLLTCNGLAVLGSIVIGDVHGLNHPCHGCHSYIKKISNFFSDLIHLSFQKYTFITAKGNVTTTAATGILVFEHNTSGLNNDLLTEDSSLQDGRLHAFILAPSSIVSYLYYLFLSDFINKLSSKNLPKSIGWIASTGLEITSEQPIKYVIEGKESSENSLHLEIISAAVKIHLGRKITDTPINNANKDKETIRVQGLPQAEKVKMLESEAIPFLPVASEEEFKELFIGLRQSANISSVYVVLMILSTLLATTGLFQNSTPVIIGAMILAPLMAPIVSFSMGVVRGDKELLKESMKTLWIGIATALVFSCIFTYLMPLNFLTDEMHSRLNPNILDLMVAIISGIAGAYAYAKSEIAKSLAGVAIAVALVPPLSVTGIGIGWWDTEMIYGSFLLFMTNLAGITLSASLTFLVMGFSPVRRATKGIVWTSLFLVLITIPLVVSFFKVIEQNEIREQLKTIDELVLDNRAITIRTISVDLSKEIPVIYIKTRSDSALKEKELQGIISHINNLLQRPVTVDILSEIELKSKEL